MLSREKALTKPYFCDDNHDLYNMHNPEIPMKHVTYLYGEPLVVWDESEPKEDTEVEDVGKDEVHKDQQVRTLSSGKVVGGGPSQENNKGMNVAGGKTGESWNLVKLPRKNVRSNAQDNQKESSIATNNKYATLESEQVEHSRGETQRNNDEKQDNIVKERKKNDAPAKSRNTTTDGKDHDQVESTSVTINNNEVVKEKTKD
ncbi:hypothetical protein K7X08_011779 [Anisodus acutangulus]|uniref:Uncharacterized protein n=1 Tax=Anisodus acutangulus TaxID=402998 RepID=A0A9Q1RIV6_9SOLA|nr:hypothetical protein K7X08_011779 [Anisodus acutangulus]